MVTTNLVSEEDVAALTLVEYSKAPRKIFKEVTTSLTPEEEEEAEHEVLALIQLSQNHPIKRRKRVKADKSQPEEVEVSDQAKQRKKRQPMKKDNSEETLTLLLNWNKTKPAKPPFLLDLVGNVCSKPVRKQLMGSDVKKDQSRLKLRKAEVKKMVQQVMGRSDKVGTKGLEVSVYGQEGEVGKMMFKMWSVNTPVLMGIGWKTFVKDNDLTKHCDFLTIWMFRHKNSDEICFAIDKTRHHTVTRPLSKRISKAVFKNPN
ncbi:unnamed protein product [Brassica oleracea var. botrytis]|uniref:TF-B3 domain-containing protein n=2 Tax=Brassica TaxID=3705 RepID=A0A3P6ALC7_BRAOL|nr:unnamed protein product [Brassica napus]CDY24929.1 BnaC03g22430D [Brassica napus]VDC89869.1 unnamed protein product [Brassica oleracea]